jgi:maltoporin
MVLSLLPATFIIISSTAFAATFDATGYMRAGTGWNGSGRRIECVGNRGAPANEFRLGNECSIFAELSLNGRHDPEPKAKGETGFFDSHIMVSFFPEGRRLYDKVGTTADGAVKAEDLGSRGVNLTEAYVDGGRYQDIPYTFWAGKRFYREGDINIFDWFSFGDTSGVGGGIIGIPMPSGELSIAHLIQGSETTPSTGVPIIQMLDARWRKIKTGEKGDLLIWLGYAWSSLGDDGLGQRYVDGRGGLLGAQWKQSFTDWNNELAVIYGHGLLQGFNLYGPNPMIDEAGNRANRWRITETFQWQLAPQWSVLGVLAAEIADSGATSRAFSRYSSAGFRLFYQPMDHLRWLVETGHSRISSDADVDAGGTWLGERSLTRVTFAAELTPSKSIWGRPVLRAYAAGTFWNDANRTKVPTSLQREAQTFNFGYQGEVWF